MSQLTELQDYLKVLGKQVQLKKMVESLMENNDFKEVILKGFCQDEMTRCMQMSVYEKATAEQRELYIQLAKASAALDNYLNTIVVLGRTAEEDMDEIQKQIEDLLVNGEDE